MRCESGMGSRVLMNLISPHDVYPAGRALCSPKSNHNGELYRLFEVGEEEAYSTQHIPRPRGAQQVVWGLYVAAPRWIDAPGGKARRGLGRIMTAQSTRSARDARLRAETRDRDCGASIPVGQNGTWQALRPSRGVLARKRCDQCRSCTPSERVREGTTMPPCPALKRCLFFQMVNMIADQTAPAHPSHFYSQVGNLSAKA
jgi:hypothetical protein